MVGVQESYTFMTGGIFVIGSRIGELRQIVGAELLREKFS